MKNLILSVLFSIMTVLLIIIFKVNYSIIKNPDRTYFLDDSRIKINVETGNANVLLLHGIDKNWICKPEVK